MSEDTPDADAGAETGADVDADADGSAEAEAERESGGATGSNGADGEESGSERDLVERVAAHDESLAAEVAALREEKADVEADLREAESEAEGLTERLQRTQADFQNYKKRAEREREQVRERATEDLVERLVEVRDNLARALEEADADDADDAAVREGVEATLDEFDRILDQENVEVIDPDPGAEVDPARHQVMLRVDSDRPEGTIDEVYRPGYEMAGKVLREARVTVSDGE